MSQQKSGSGVDQKSMGSIRNNPWIKGSVSNNSFQTRQPAKRRYVGKNKISSILHKWNSNAQQEQEEKSHTKRSPPPPKKIYAEQDQSTITPSTKSDERLPKTNEDIASIPPSAMDINHPDTDELRKQNESLQSEIQILKQTKQDFEGKINALNRTINHLQTSLQTAESKTGDHTQHKKEILSLREQLETLRHALAANEDEITHNKEREKLVQVLQRRIDESQKEIQNVNTEKDDAIAELRNANKLKTSENKQCKQRIQLLEKELKEEKTQNVELKQRVSVYENAEIDGFKQKLKALRDDKDNEILALNDILEEKNKELKDHEKYITQLKKRNDHLMNQNEKLMMESGELIQRTQDIESLLEKMKRLEVEDDELKQTHDGDSSHVDDDVG
eukprot:132688_1